MWEKIKHTLYVPFIMIYALLFVMYHIFRLFFITPFENWFENIRNAEGRNRGNVILRGILIILGLAALMALGVYNNSSTEYDYERDHYDEYRSEPGW